MTGSAISMHPPAGLRLRIPAILLLLSLAAPAAGQVSFPTTLSLQAAIERALTANPTISAARLTTAINRAGLALASERPNPEFTAEFEKDTPHQSFGISLPVELGGKRSRRVAAGLATIQTGDAEVAATIAQIRNDVRRTYADVMVGEARVTVLGALRDLSTRVRDTAEARFDSGDAPQLEVLEAGLALASAENEVAVAQAELTSARARLNALLGQPLDTIQTLSTTLDAFDAVPVDIALALARSGSAELKVLDRRIDEQRARAALAQALRLPDLVPSATLTRGSQPDFTYGWRVGFSMALPLFTTHHAAVRVEQATLDQLTAAREVSSARMTADVTASAVTVEARRSSYLRYRDVILPQAQQVEQMAQDAYQLGRTGITALLQALQTSRDVRLRSLDTLAQWHTALAELERAIGAPLP